ncbi:MAG TPA: isoprenylcysteine carboxylmethyltransferase family protein [Vicinamibacteria bacterium]|nr:isoprenylcysteine carboxylmethyltransferase family protein [Vicinamibacteria bacterium]
MPASDALARARVPLGWALGLAALYFARPRPGFFVTGLIVAGLGEALRLWASGHLEKNRRLATSGPYAMTRNPLYLGSLVIGIGFVLAAGRPELAVPLAALFWIVYWPVMKREADRLREAFPSSYAQYETRVPLLLPRPGQGSGDGFAWRRVRENREHVTVLGILVVAVILAWRLVE